VTIVASVSPPGGDFSEPVCQASLRVTGALWALTSDLAHRRHFPAIDWAQSFTLYADRLSEWFQHEAGGWNTLREGHAPSRARRELQGDVQLVGLDAHPDGSACCLNRPARSRGLSAPECLSPRRCLLPAGQGPDVATILHFARVAGQRITAGVPLNAVLRAGFLSGCCAWEKSPRPTWTPTASP
jgi:V/A-type H+-transporting ATPase subunit A